MYNLNFLNSNQRLKFKKQRENTAPTISLYMYDLNKFMCGAFSCCVVYKTILN
jgi:hypothetical protein